MRASLSREPPRYLDRRIRHRVMPDREYSDIQGILPRKLVLRANDLRRVGVSRQIAIFERGVTRWTTERGAVRGGMFQGASIP
jgi:hypothetical protein